MVLPQNTLGSSQQSLSFFSAGEPASVFTGTAGVVAGTDSFVTRRWNGRGGGRRWSPGVQSSSGAFSLEQVSAPVLLGEIDSCGVVSESSIQSGFENSLEDAGFAVAGAESDFHDAHVVVPGSSGAGAGFSCSLQDDFAVVESRTLGTSGGRGEVNHSGAQMLPGAGLQGTGTSRYDPKRGQREVAELVTMRPSSSPVSSAVGRRQRRVRCARVKPPAAGGISTVSQRNEAGSSLDLASIRVESPSSRVARVTYALHDLCLAHACMLVAR